MCRRPPHSPRLVTALLACVVLSAAGVAQERYSLDGRGNNVEHPEWGARNTPEAHRYGYCYADGRSSPRLVANPEIPNAKTEYGSCVSRCRTFQGNGGPGSWSHNGSPPFFEVDARPLSCDYGCNDILSANARNISNRIFTNLRRRQIINEKRVNDLHTFFGHLISHDMHHSRDGSESWPVRVPECDAWWDPDCSGTVTQGFQRFVAAPGTGESGQPPLKPINFLSSWLDGNVIYGGDDAGGKPSIFNWLRNGDPNDGAFHSCRLQVVQKPNFSGVDPHQTYDIPEDAKGYPQFNTGMGALMIDGVAFSTGNFRGNVDPGVLGLITVFTRYHNDLCDKLVAKNPEKRAEEAFWEARKWVIATLQKTFYYEYIPALLGKPLKPYGGYNASLDPAFDPYHTMAAMRYGHSEVNEMFLRLDESWSTHPSGHLTFRDAILSPGRALESGLDPMLRGLVSQPQGRVDAYIIDYMVNGQLAGPVQRPWTVAWGGGHCLARRGGSSTTAHGLFDLQSMNIQRGREQGLCGINTVRRAMGLEPHGSWEDMVVGPGWDQAPANDPGRRLAEDLRAMYGDDVDDGDFWVAGLAERRSAGDSNVGDTFARVLVDNWGRLRQADRFYFENVANGLFTQDEVEDLLKTSLSDVIRSVTGIEDMPGRAFFVPGSQIDGATRIGGVAALPDFSEYAHTHQPSPFFKIAWSEVPGEPALDIAIAAPTLGWVGVGFSDQSSHVMRNADMVVGRLHDGMPHVDDMYSIDITPPIRDQDRSPPGEDSLTNTRIVQENGVTSVFFRRPVDSGDPWDRGLRMPSGQVRVAFAFQPHGKTTLEYHGAMRGYASLQLFEPRCPNGTHLSSVQMTCSLCAPGSYRTEDMALGSCPRCPRGSFQPSVGSAECLPCSVGPVEGTTTMFQGALHVEDCVCPVGMFLSRISMDAPPKCEACRLGMFCPGGMGDPLQESGYSVEVQRRNPLQVNVWECQRKRACPRGPLGSCAGNSQGLMCTQCSGMDHYWSTDEKACVPCSESRSSWILASYTIGTAFSMFMLYKISMVWGEDQALSDPLELGIAIALMLHLGKSGSVYSKPAVSWGSPLQELMQLTSIFSLDARAKHAQCLLGFDLFAQYLSGSLTPLVVMLVYLAVALILPRVSSFRDAPLRCWNCVGHICQTFFIGFLLHGVQPFAVHRQPNGCHSVNSLPGLIEEHPDHTAFAVVGALHVMFYGGGFIAYSIFACWQLRARARLGTARGVRAVLWHRFVYINFRPTRFYWSIVHLVRNTLLALIPVMVDEAVLQIVTMQRVLYVSVCAHCYFWPYKRLTHNFVDVCVILTLIALNTAAACFIDTSGDYERTLVVGSVSAAFTTCGVLVVVLVAAVLVGVVRKGLMTAEQRLVCTEHALKKRTMFYAELQQVDEKDLSAIEAEWRGVEADLLCKAPLPLLSVTDILNVVGTMPNDLATASQERLLSLEIDFVAPSEYPYMKAVRSCMRVLEERLRARIQETVDARCSADSSVAFSRSYKRKRRVSFGTQLAGQIAQLEQKSFSRVSWDAKEQTQISSLGSRVMEFQSAYADLFRGEEESLKLLQIFVARMEQQFRGVYQACVKDMLEMQPGFSRTISAARTLNQEAERITDTRSERYEVIDRTFSSYANFMVAAIRTQEATYCYARTVAAATGGSITRTAAKNLYRILEKLALDPKVAAGEEAHAWDAARTMVQYDTMDAMAKGVEQILEDHRSGRVEVVRTKERFSEPTSGGWSDVLLNLRFPSSCKELSKLPFELQLAHTQMMVIRKEMGGHHGYAKCRSAKEIVEFLSYDAPVDSTVRAV